MKRLIKKGQHRGWAIRWPFLNPFKSYTLKFTFNKSMWYPGGGTGWNKIGGSSSIYNYWESYRVGWRPSKEMYKFDACIYSYVRGKRNILELGTFKIGDELTTSIDKHLFKQNFYFGGQDTAPHDMWVYSEYVTDTELNEILYDEYKNIFQK